MEIEQELIKAKDILKKSKKPIFFCDDDLDGISSAIMLKKYKNSGYIYPVVASPEVKKRHIQIVKEQKGDVVFVLDKPLISKEFLDNIDVPVIWIDHHPVQEPSKTLYINPRLIEEKDNRPTSYWVYKMIRCELWLATLANIADWHITDIVKEYAKQHPEILPRCEDIKEILKETKVGEIVRIISLNMKGGIKDVKETIDFLMKIKGPDEILQQKSEESRKIYEKYLKRKKEYEAILRKAEEAVSEDKILLFSYKDIKTSYTSELSNDLIMKYPDKIIIVGRINNGWFKGSVRSTKIELPTKIKRALIGRDGYGGGHKNACGLVIKENEFDIFLEEFKKLIRASGEI